MEQAAPRNAWNTRVVLLRATGWKSLRASNVRGGSEHARPRSSVIRGILYLGATGFVTGMLTGRAGAGHGSVTGRTTPARFTRYPNYAGVYSVRGVAQLAVLVVKGDLLGHESVAALSCSEGGTAQRAAARREALGLGAPGSSAQESGYTPSITKVPITSQPSSPLTPESVPGPDTSGKGNLLTPLAKRGDARAAQELMRRGRGVLYVPDNVPSMSAEDWVKFLAGFGGDDELSELRQPT